LSGKKVRITQKLDKTPNFLPSMMKLRRSILTPKIVKGMSFEIKVPFKISSNSIAFLFGMMKEMLKKQVVNWVGWS
jgi:hypothetical protein